MKKEIYFQKLKNIQIIQIFSEYFNIKFNFHFKILTFNFTKQWHIYLALSLLSQKEITLSNTYDEENIFTSIIDLIKKISPTTQIEQNIATHDLIIKPGKLFGIEQSNNTTEFTLQNNAQQTIEFLSLILPFCAIKCQLFLSFPVYSQYYHNIDFMISDLIPHLPYLYKHNAYEEENPQPITITILQRNNSVIATKICSLPMNKIRSVKYLNLNKINAINCQIFNYNASYNILTRIQSVVKQNLGQLPNLSIQFMNWKRTEEKRIVIGIQISAEYLDGNHQVIELMNGQDAENMANCACQLFLNKIQNSGSIDTEILSLGNGISVITSQINQQSIEVFRLMEILFGIKYEIQQIQIQKQDTKHDINLIVVKGIGLTNQNASLE